MILLDCPQEETKVSKNKMKKDRPITMNHFAGSSLKERDTMKRVQKNTGEECMSMQETHPGDHTTRKRKKCETNVEGKMMT
jgi:hypothetical protein